MRDPLIRALASTLVLFLAERDQHPDRQAIESIAHSLSFPAPLQITKSRLVARAASEGTLTEHEAAMIEHAFQVWGLQPLLVRALAIELVVRLDESVGKSAAPW